MKVLILSCPTGGGHNAAGQAMAEALTERGHEAVFLEYLRLSGDHVSDIVGDCYVNLVKYAPRVFGAVYQVALGLSRLLHGRPSPVYAANMLAAKSLGIYIEENQFDAILMPHLYPAESITHLKRQGQKLPLTVAIGTDYTCIPFWEETDCDYVVLPGEDLIPEYVSRGIPREKLLPMGIPVSPAFAGAKQRNPEQLRRKAGIGAGEKVYLVMGGSMGFGRMDIFVGELLNQCRPGEWVIVICGNNESLRKRLKKRFGHKNQIKIIGYTAHVAEYMAISDVVYTKPGGLTTTEVAVMEKPMVHTAPIPGCETYNAEYFAGRGMSVSAKGIREGLMAGRTLMHDSSLQQEMAEQQRKHINAQAAEDICRFLETHGSC